MWSAIRGRQAFHLLGERPPPPRPCVERETPSLAGSSSSPPPEPGLTPRSTSRSTSRPTPAGLEPHRFDALLETLGWTSCLAAEGIAPQLLLLRRDAEIADLLRELTGALCAAFLELVSCQSLRDAELQKTAGILAGCLMSLCHQQADAKVSLTDCIMLLKHSVHQLVAAQADAHSDFRAAPCAALPNHGAE